MNVPASTDRLSSTARRWMTDESNPLTGELHQESQKAERVLLSTEATGGRYQRSLYELFSEMEEKDGHLYSLLQTRLNALLGLEMTVLPSGKDDSAHEFVQEAIAAIPRFREFLRALLDAFSKGFSVLELIWDYDAKGRLIISDWQAHPQEYFAFSPSGQLRLLSPPFPKGTESATHSLQTRSGNAGYRSCAPPSHKFVVLYYGRDARNPFGRGLCQRAYWYYWFKKNTLRSWSLYNEKYGSPLAVAKVDSSVSEEERRNLLEILDSLQTDAGVVVPDSVQLEFLEAAKNGNGDSFRSLADWCNDEMARIVLGATLTTGEGRRSGSMALGNVHESVRQDYLESDARLLEGALNDTIVRWLVELNDPQASIPKLQFTVESPQDLEQQIRIDTELVRLGVPIALDDLYRRYGRTTPTENQRALSYDDSNLFQYHLRFGVLTINEVRKRLQLPPVRWGDQPTSERFVSGDQLSTIGDGVPQDGSPESGREEERERERLER